MKQNIGVELNFAESNGGDLKTFGVGESMKYSTQMLQIEKKEDERKSGISLLVASYFITAQMAGAGFLALPKGIAQCGWTGIFLMIAFSVTVGFISCRLGTCWVILEERWDQYKERARQPYMDIAEKSLGIHGRRLALFSVLVTQTGSTIVYLILMSEMMSNLVPALSQCEWTVVIAAVLLPFVWLDSLKDIWQASILAVVATVIAVIVIVVKLILDRDIFLAENPTYPSPTISSLALGFGTILFSFGGAPCLPTIQNDMKCRSDFWKSTIIAFVGLLTLYLPVGVTGYVLLGDSVQSNILLSIGPGVTVTVAIAMQMFNLLGTYIISINPVVSSLEDILQIPREFGWKRVSMRSGLMVLELIVAFSIPDFGLIVDLVGGTTMSLLSFILPSLMYMKLVDNKSDPTWPERKVSILERIFFWIVILVGLIGGLSANFAAIVSLVEVTSLQKSCFVDFLGISS